MVKDRTRLHRSRWKNMMRRCYETDHHAYESYGGRGITVDRRWHNPVVFGAWCESNGVSKGLQLDRIDNDGPYSPENCRFVTAKENCRNRRKPEALFDWVIGTCVYSSASEAAVGEGVSSTTVRRWCLGYYDGVKEHKPKKGCYRNSREDEEYTNPAYSTDTRTSHNSTGYKPYKSYKPRSWPKQ